MRWYQELEEEGKYSMHKTVGVLFNRNKKSTRNRQVNNHKLVSLDIVSLFTNVPIQLAQDYINQSYDILNTTIPKEFILNTIKFIFSGCVWWIK